MELVAQPRFREGVTKNASSLVQPDSKYRLSLGQLVLAGFVFCFLLALSFSSFASSNRALRFESQSVSATTQSSAIIIAQRETLVYGIKLSEWLHGAMPRRDVQIARATLAQRLYVKDFTGSSLGERADPEYFRILKESDALVASGGSGYLSSVLQVSFLTRGRFIIDNLISQSHVLINDYTQTVSSQIESNANSLRNAARKALDLLFLSFFLSTILVIWIVRSFRRQYRSQRQISDVNQKHLEEVREELGAAHEVVQSLQNINEAKTDFVATVNHELRTPLTSIIGYIDILKTFSLEKHDDEFRKYLNVMDRNAAVLLDLVESILLLSALDASELLHETSSIDLIEKCKKSISALQYELNSSSIKVDVDYDRADFYTIQGVPALFSQVFSNLLSNAIKFSPTNSTIRVSFIRITNAQKQSVIRIEVRDQGMGIAGEEIGLLFSKFYRARNASASGIPGSGLGLAIVQKIVALHGGTILIESSLGVGTAVIVEVPTEITPLERLVMGNRGGVIERGINSINESSVENLEATAHEVGGAIGFYTFSQESRELLDFSRWLRSNPKADLEAILTKKADLLDMLRNSLSRIPDEETV